MTTLDEEASVPGDDGPPAGDRAVAPDEPVGAPEDHHEPPVHVITPATGWIHLGLADVWEYRELLYFLTWRDIKVRYKQTALGAAWAVLGAGGELVLCTAEPHGPVTGRVRSRLEANRRVARAVPGEPGTPPDDWPLVEIGR